MCIPWLLSCSSQEFDLKTYFTVNDCSTNSDEGAGEGFFFSQMIRKSEVEAKFLNKGIAIIS